MNFESWKQQVPDDIKEDPVWKMKVYRLSLFMSDLCWFDLSALYEDKRTTDLAGQLYSATGSISANLSEGYSRNSKSDQARFYEYSLGSARETRGWYYKGRHLLREVVVDHRIKLLSEVIRMLLKIVSSTRPEKVKENVEEYTVSNHKSSLEELLIEVPMPEE